MSALTDQVSIRPYTLKDRPGLRKISYDTSFLGKADELFDEPELLADALTLYFTDSEPQSIALGPRILRKVACHPT